MVAWEMDIICEINLFWSGCLGSCESKVSCELIITRYRYFISYTMLKTIRLVMTCLDVLYLSILLGLFKF